MILANRKLLAAAALFCLAGTAVGQSTHPEGTITHNRPSLQKFSPSTNGWMSTQNTPRFWTWELSPLITDFTKTSPIMNQWIHEIVPADLVNSSGVIDTAKLTALANSIGDSIVAGGYSGGDYAIFLQNWVWRTRVSQSVNDELDEELNGSGVPLAWSTSTNGRHTGNTATPWRGNGLADTYGDNLAASLINLIELRVLADPGYSTFPKPARVFFDEEFAPGIVCGLEPIAMMMSITNDSRYSTNAIEGNFHLWDSTPSATTMDELFYSADLVDMSSWVPSTTYDDYTAQTLYNGGTCGSCPQPCNDLEYYPIYNRLGGALKSTRDGLIQASFGDAIDGIWGTDVLWSNYSTSIWNTESYPSISNGDRGAREESDRLDLRYGFAQSASVGIGDMHAPVLYPPFEDHMYDTLPDSAPSGTAAPETHAQAWIRAARTKLDHAIFSFTEIDTLDSNLTPKRFSPWVLAVGTRVYVPNTSSNTTLSSKVNVRDITALCKSRGANELIFWANPNPNGSGFQIDNQTDWDSTNDVLSQVYDYNLSSVVVNSNISSTPNASALADMTFGEEHAFDVPAQLIPFVGSTVVYGLVDAEFTRSNVSTDAANYTLIVEIIDGGGPWDGQVPQIAVYNHISSAYETLTPTYTELFSTSTRRAEFTDTDFDDYSDGYTRIFDNQSDLPTSALASDRKSIHRFDFTLPVGSGSASDYFSSNKVTFQMFSSRVGPSGISTADPIRIDLIQLYETDLVNDNINVVLPIPGDLNNDQTIDLHDIRLFMQQYAVNPSTELDLNDDGEINIEDLEQMIQFSK